jgi:acetoin utilization protein AcuB
MTVETLISTSTPPLKHSDTVEFALGLILDLRVRHLPVVDDDRHVIGILSEDALLDSGGPEMLVSALISAQPVTIAPTAHIFEATGLMIEHHLTTLPVTDENGLYIGLIQRQDLFEWYANTLGTQRPGAILTVEVDERDYSLSRLIYSVEQSEVRVHSISTEPVNAETNRIRVTIKINTVDAARVRHILEHNGYKVVAAYGAGDDEDLTDRIQEFMRYLEV